MEIKTQFYYEHPDNGNIWITAKAEFEVFRCDGDMDTPSFLDFEYKVTEVIIEEEDGNVYEMVYTQLIIEVRESIDYEIEKAIESKIMN